jgi:hypothetical protein
VNCWAFTVTSTDTLWFPTGTSSPRSIQLISMSLTWYHYSKFSFIFEYWNNININILPDESDFDVCVVEEIMSPHKHIGSWSSGDCSYFFILIRDFLLVVFFLLLLFLFSKFFLISFFNRFFCFPCLVLIFRFHSFSKVNSI